MLVAAELPDFLLGKKSWPVALKEKMQPSRLLKLLDRPDRGIQRSSCDDRPVVRQKDGAVLSRETAYRIADCGIAGAMIGDERGSADFHEIVGRQRREDVLRIDVGQHRHCDRMGGMQVDDRACAAATFIERAMEGDLLGGRVPAHMSPLPIDYGESLGVQKS